MGKTGFVDRWFPTYSQYPESRLFSLDVLRGLDMILLTVIGPVVRAAQKSWECFPPAMMDQMRHNWTGFTLWDIIMPLFIFMCGAAIPFALGRRLREGRGVFWRHVLARVALLWVMGGMVQGNWAAMNPLTFSPFANTLQSIAVGYLATAFLMTLRTEALRVAIPIALAAAYAAIMALFGDYSQHGNIAFKIDHAIFSAILPAENEYVAKPSYYAWVLPSMMFAAMTMCGYHASEILRRQWSGKSKALVLFGGAAALFSVGIVSSIWIPVIKPVYSLSFTALAMGWCVLLLAALYVACDIWKIRRGTALVLLFGQCALTAYFVSHFFSAPLASLAETLMQSARVHFSPALASFLVAVCKTAMLVAVMVAWRRLKASVRTVAQ